MKYLSLFFILIVYVGAFTQTQQDSLFAIWNNKAKSDTARVNALLKLSESVFRSNPDTCLYFAEIALEYSEEINYNDGIARSFFVKGIAWKEKGDRQQAIELYHKAINQISNISKKNYSTPAQANQRLSMRYMTQGDFPKATDHGFKALEIYTNYSDQLGIANSNTFLGYIYKNQGTIETALEFFMKADSIYLILKDTANHNSSLINLAIVYTMNKDYDEAEKLFFEVKESYEKNPENLGSLNSVYNNIGFLYQEKKDFKLALEYYEKSLNIAEERKDWFWISLGRNNVGMMAMEMGDQNKAIEFCQSGYKISKKLKFIRKEIEACLCLTMAYEKIGDFRNSLKFNKEYHKLQDSIRNEKNTEELTKKKMTFQFQRKQLADSIQFANQKEMDQLTHQAEMEKQAKQKYMLYGGIGVLLLIGLFVYRGYSQKKKDNLIIRKQKEEVEHQKEIVEEANREIKDSITYAKRIQSAILPSNQIIKEHLPNSFVLYKPKDIVAGDFYWMESFAKASASEGILLAAADCTGHGVPGAMVSVVCNNGLNRSVREYGLTDPGEILDKTRELVIKEFEKSEEKVKDGMDVALVALAQSEFESESEGLRTHTSHSLSFAGAHNPLWIIRKGSTIIEEIKADKQPIGQFHDPKPFTSHQIDMYSGDTFYIFSDGFADQFGGEKGKKLKTKNFKELLYSLQELSMEDQKKKLDSFITEWMGETEQIDDICVIGVRL